MSDDLNRILVLSGLKAITETIAPIKRFNGGKSHYIIKTENRQAISTNRNAVIEEKLDAILNKLNKIIESFEMNKDDMNESDEPWTKDNPKKKHKSLSPEKKAAAKARAKRAGRPYPNLVDNMFYSSK